MWRNGSNDFRNTNACLSVSDCVFTSASNINNRSLFPCQEPPIAMATWQAVITTPNSFRSKSHSFHFSIGENLAKAQL